MSKRSLLSISGVLAVAFSTALLLAPVSSDAQSRVQPKGKPARTNAPKIYCWDTPTGRQCGDTMPAEAAGASREEFSSRTGTKINEVQRAKTPEEIEQEKWAQQVEESKRAQAERIEREVSTLRLRYDSVDAIRQDFADRRKGLEVGLGLAQDSAKTAHGAFVSALDSVSALEMDGKAVTPAAFQRVSEKFKEWQERRSGVETSQSRLAELDRQLETSIQLWLGVPLDDPNSLFAPSNVVSSEKPVQE